MKNTLKNMIVVVACATAVSVAIPRQASAGILGTLAEIGKTVGYVAMGPAGFILYESEVESEAGSKTLGTGSKINSSSSSSPDHSIGRIELGCGPKPPTSHRAPNWPTIHRAPPANAHYEKQVFTIPDSLMDRLPKSAPPKEVRLQVIQDDPRAVKSSSPTMAEPQVRMRVVSPLPPLTQPGVNPNSVMIGEKAVGQVRPPRPPTPRRVVSVVPIPMPKPVSRLETAPLPQPVPSPAVTHVRSTSMTKAQVRTVVRPHVRAMSLRMK